MLGNGVVAAAVYRTLQVVGGLVFVGAGGYLVREMIRAEEAPKPPVWHYSPPPEMPRTRCSDSDMYEAMDQGSCLLFVKVYGTNEVVKWTVDDCVTAIGAVTHHLDVKIQRAKDSGGEKL